MDDCVSHARRDGHASLGDDVFTLPPTRRKLTFESPQALEVIETCEPFCGKLQSFRSYRVLIGNLVFSIVRKWCSSERCQLSSHVLQCLQRLEDEQGGRARRRVRFAQNIFEVPAFSRRNRTRAEKSNQPALRTRNEILLTVGMDSSPE